VYEGVVHVIPNGLDAGWCVWGGGGTKWGQQQQQPVKKGPSNHLRETRDMMLGRARARGGGDKLKAAAAASRAVSI
jgi:hypothetical protein